MAGDAGMEPTTDAVEAVQPDKDALLIAELKQLLREAVPMIEAAWEEHVSLSPTKRFDPWQGERWLDRAKETLGDAWLGGKEA